MKKMNQTFRLSVLPGALFAAFGSAMAQDDVVAEFSKPDSSASVGAGYWSDDRHRTGVYDGMRDKGGYGLLDADGAKRDDATGTWYLFNARNLGLDNRDFRVDVLRQGHIGGFLEYSRTPRDNPFTINTATQGIGSTNLTVGTTQGGTFGYRNVDLETVRELMRLGGFMNLMPGLDFKIDYKHEDKTGTRQMGWGSAALFSVEPINSTTQQLEMMLQYSTNALKLSGGYYGSWYENNKKQLLEQLNGITGGTSASFNPVTPISLPLNNEAHQIFLDGDYAFSPMTRGTFKLAYTQGTQDEHLPSVDLTGANAPFSGTPSHLNGKIDTTLVYLGLNSRPIPKLSVTGSLRYYDQDDKTPVNQFVESTSGTAPNTTTTRVFNTPFSYRTTTGKLEATYQLPQRFNVTGGIDYSTENRSTPVAAGTTSTANATGVTTGLLYVPFRSEVNETTYRLQLRRNLADDLNGSLWYLHSDRNGSSFDAANGTAFANQINPMHTANRNRDKLRFTLDWSPLDRLSLQFRLEGSLDKYPDDGRPFGLKKGEASLFAIDGTYSISENWKFSGWYSHDMTKAKEVGFRAASSGAADAIKDSRLKDTGDNLGLSVRGILSPKIDIGAALEWYSNTSSYPQSLTLLGSGSAFPSGFAGGLPDIKNELTRFKLDGRYVVDKRSEWRFDYIYEHWHSNDWSWTFAGGAPFTYFSGNINCSGCVNAATGAPLASVGVVDGTSVLDKRSQTSNFIGVRYVYKF